MTDEVRIIDISDAESVPENVLEGIEDVANGRFATKEELLAVCKEGCDNDN